MDIKKLTEDELNEVYGGGSGVLAAGEKITFTSYSTITTGRYYSSRSGDYGDIVYLYGYKDGYCFFNREKFSVNGNKWSSTCDVIDSCNEFNFKHTYRYILNVTP